MGLLDNYTGVGMSPRPKWEHQRIIDKCIYLVYEELDSQGLFMLSEATVTDDWEDLAPDLVIFDDRYTPLSIIEITTHRELRQIMNKCNEIIPRFPESEYFVYDYEKQVLYKLTAEGWISSMYENIYSNYLSQPLTAYFYIP